MLLSDGELQEALASGHLRIDPPPSGNSIQPASIDLHLGPDLYVQSREAITGIIVNPEAVDVNRLVRTYAEYVDLAAAGRWVLRPGDFVIGETNERIDIPHDLGARVEGRSRLARLGVGVHITAPKIDPGFGTTVTLEIQNQGAWANELTAGMRICTLLVERLGKAAQEGYGGAFQGA